MPKKVEFVKDVDKAIFVMRDAGKWLEETGRRPSKWWQLTNLNQEFLFQYARPDEFFVGLINGKPAVAAILQMSQTAQDWKFIDRKKSVQAMYIHWLCVHRDFARQNLPKTMVDFAASLATQHKINLLRVDTKAEEAKLRQIYEKLGFKLIDIIKEDYRKTAFYQKPI